MAEAVGDSAHGGVTDRPLPRVLAPRAQQIAAAAQELLESKGAEALTMRRVAEALGIQAPSLYKHFPSKQAIEVALIEGAFERIGLAMREALAGVPSPEEAIPALLARYRAESLPNPNLYRLATTGRLPRHLLVPGLEDWAGEPFFLATGDPSLAQALWSFAHGMVILEIDGRYPEGSDLDRTWAAGSSAFADVLARRRNQPVFVSTPP